MAKRLFGTDGLRGTVNKYPMTAEMALRLGLAAGTYFNSGSQRRHSVVIGKDTRLSGYVFEHALTSGLCATGMDVFLVGPIPTPAIAFLTKNMRADFGVVISASHNPYHDNGIKFFDKNGYKLPDSTENIITEMISDQNWEWEYPEQKNIGRAKKIEDSLGRYIVYLKNTFPSQLTLDGMRVVLDCANGAAYKVGPRALEELGAEVFTLSVEPNGTNINYQCGSLYPELLAAKVKETRADIGLALDGDADRLIVVDEKANILDGDQLMAIFAEDMMRTGRLKDRNLVATIMSNMALEVFMRQHNGKLTRTQVGDRYVVESMRESGATLGGEQSGHIIFNEYSTTGDGLMAGLQLLKILKERQKPLSEIAGLLQLYPQELINVVVQQKTPIEECQPLQKAINEAEAELKDKGRVLLRYSGTEPKLRVMVEGEDAEQVKKLATELATLVKKLLG
ncbi:phosphoglucosamine mutase [Desulfovibrio litoralis]|uniref:Phosphoglucosamine mutase n=1 Tax=Desulfovibrio litoralis DSM 11393 TaxID=1121455 RepID=A0A1M7SKU9_9BACT|nr:phosphoglucosamine mutase [Desulfovibrio litoralis]SHN59101.1 phosphoglucosamine mutase [Desulfovibrio litoralis DSM 11393]